MPTPPADAPLSSLSKEQIAALAKLDDRFAYAFDPFSAERDEAERVFMQDVANWYDSLPSPKPSLQDFRKAIIVRCRKHLVSTTKPPSI